MNTRALIAQELDALEIQFGRKSMLTLDDYAELYNIKRVTASHHLRTKGIPFSKEGKMIYISPIDIAKYKVKCRVDGGILSRIEPRKRKRQLTMDYKPCGKNK